MLSVSSKLNCQVGRGEERERERERERESTRARASEREGDTETEGELWGYSLGDHRVQRENVMAN